MLVTGAAVAWSLDSQKSFDTVHLYQNRQQDNRLYLIDHLDITFLARGSTAMESLNASTIRIKGRHFVDPEDRVIHLRGANVSGISKVPSSDPAVDILHPDKTSYVGRPFPLEDAPTHWRRLKRWGLRYLRITVTWEAIEHEGPGIYDEAYLSYLRKLLQSMTEHGLVAYLCMHQDVWSRHCGGSGAPAWTLSAAGFDLSEQYAKLEATGAAYVTGVKSRGKVTPGDRGLWPTGYQKLACATMNTLFWGGRTFAPGFMVSDTAIADKFDANQTMNIQDMLQERYLAVFQKLVSATGDIDGVLGYEMMNEPHPGYIGMKSLHDFNYNTDLHLGTFPSPLQSFALGDGHSIKVPKYVRSFPWPTRLSSYEVLNPGNASVWREGASKSGQQSSRCPWAKEGVWAWDKEKNKAVVLRDGYFSKRPDGKGDVDFYSDFFWPFVERWEQAVKSSLDELERNQPSSIEGGDRLRDRKMLHVECVPNENGPRRHVLKALSIVLTGEFLSKPSREGRYLTIGAARYDLNALFTKSLGNLTVNVQGLSRGMFVLRALYWGAQGIKDNYALQIRNIVREANRRIGETPIIFGECGVPIDLKMMDALISALESSMVGFNLWTYSPANRDDIGDDWNNENFSWYSDVLRERTDTSGAPEDLDLGARILDQVARPYALRTAGIPLSQKYESEWLAFSYGFKNAAREVTAQSPSLVAKSNQTVIYLAPAFMKALEAGDLKVVVSDGDYEVDAEAQELRWTHKEVAPDFIHRIRIFSFSLAKRKAAAFPKEGLGAAVFLLILFLVYLLRLNVMGDL